ELEPAVELDDDLAVQRRVGWQEIAELSQLRKISKQRPLVSTPERELSAVVLEHAAKAVPFRLVLPALALGELFHELRFHRRGRHGRARPQSPTPPALPVTSLTHPSISPRAPRRTRFPS